jgi:hypothetical protein
MAVQWHGVDAPSCQGCICAFRVVDSPESAGALGIPMGTVVALVEIGAGVTLEVSFKDLERI